MGVQKNFIVKNGIEVADNLVFAENGKVGVNTNSPDYTLDTKGDIGLSGKLYVTPETQPASTTGIITASSPFFITGVTTSLFRINDRISDGGGFIATNTKVTSIGISSIGIVPSHSRITGFGTTTITITRNLTSGEANQVLISRGENQAPTWKTIVSEGVAVSASSTSSVRYPIFSPGAGSTEGGVNTSQLSFVPSTGSLGIGTTLPTSKLDVRGDVKIVGILTVGSSSVTIDGTNNTIGVGTITLTEAKISKLNDLVGPSAIFSNDINVGAAITLGASTGIVSATSFNGDGSALVGIVTQLVSGIGIDLDPTNGRGKVTITSYKPVGKTIYVSQNGNDSNTGLAENYPKRTIKNAAGIASSGDTIKVFPGVYVEDNPIILQKTVSVEGTELRNCMITAQNSGLDLFQVNNGCHITDLSFVGAASTNGASIVAFQPLAGVSSNRFFDGARMIRMNLDFIASEAVGYLTSTSYKNPPFIVPNQDVTGCKDDVKAILKSICFDITRGGNSKCVGAGKSYYTAGGALQHITGTDTNGYSIKQATIDTLKYAIGIAHSCINNVGWSTNGISPRQSVFTQVKDLSIQPDGATNYSIGNCANVLSAVSSCVGVVTTIIDNGLGALGGAGINTTLPSAYDGQAGNNWSSSKIGGTTYSPGVGPITQGPYVRNCTNFVPNSIGMKVDGFAAEPGDQDDIGVTGSMSVDSYPQYNQGGRGVSITNGAYAQLVSIFTICDDIAIFTGSGGQCDITNSNSSFGRLGLVANGVGDTTSRSIYRYTGVAVTNVTAGNNVVAISGIGSMRPYDGQLCYFGDLYKFVDTITLSDNGSGYSSPPRVTISAPEGANGITAQATAEIDGSGKVTAINIVNSGSQYLNTPTVTIDPPVGAGVTATASVSKLQPIYYKVSSATLPSAGISTVTFVQTLNNTVSAGTTVYFTRVSLQIASSHSFEWVGSGNNINTAKPALGGVVIPENEVIQDNGGIVVYTSTDQAGNFKIGDGVVINQATGQISGRDFTKALFTTMTPFILALSE